MLFVILKKEDCKTSSLKKKTDDILKKKKIENILKKEEIQSFF
jgi:hypothetical protein